MLPKAHIHQEIFNINFVCNLVGTLIFFSTWYQVEKCTHGNIRKLFHHQKAFTSIAIMGKGRHRKSHRNVWVANVAIEWFPCLQRSISLIESKIWQHFNPFCVPIWKLCSIFYKLQPHTNVRLLSLDMCKRMVQYLSSHIHASVNNTDTLQPTTVNKLQLTLSYICVYPRALVENLDMLQSSIKCNIKSRKGSYAKAVLVPTEV